MSAPCGCGCVNVRMRSPRVRCNLESRRRWWWWHHWGYLPCTSQSLPAYSDRLHPAGCCPASSLCRPRATYMCVLYACRWRHQQQQFWLNAQTDRDYFVKMFQGIATIINIIQNNILTGDSMNWLTHRGKMEPGEKLKWMVSWCEEIEGGLGDKSHSVERWQGWSWMQPLWGLMVDSYKNVNISSM